MHGPRNQLAIVIAGHVMAHRVVIRAVTTGRARITFPTLAEAEFALRSLLPG